MSENAPHAQHPSHAPRYVAVWLALVVLTGLTYGLSHVKLGDWSLVIALAIALTKATLVALFFMHLWEERGASRLVLVVSVLFVVLLMTMTVADVATRFEPSTPAGAPLVVPVAY